MGSVLSTVVGILVGGAITFFVARRYAHRPKLTFRLDPAALIFPDELGMGPHLELRYGNSPVTNLVSLSFVLTHTGSTDVVVADAAPPRPANATLQPFFDFADFEVFSVKTVNNDESRFYVALSKALGSTRVYVNIHRIRAGTTARFQMLGTLRNGRRHIEAEQVAFFPGALPNVDVLTQGIISRPWLTKHDR
jgi:hypothetical protein